MAGGSSEPRPSSGPIRTELAQSNGHQRARDLVLAQQQITLHHVQDAESGLGQYVTGVHSLARARCRNAATLRHALPAPRLGSGHA